MNQILKYWPILGGIAGIAVYTIAWAVVWGGTQVKIENLESAVAAQVSISREQARLDERAKAIKEQVERNAQQMDRNAQQLDRIERLLMERQ